MIWALAWVCIGVITFGLLAVAIGVAMSVGTRSDEMAEHMAEKHDNDWGRWN